MRTGMNEGRKPVRRKKGFTLTELLVVMGIIALLAAVLFPVFVHTRAAGYQATCASNLKQIGIAMQMYCQDNNDAIFPALPHADDSGIAEWCFYKVISPKLYCDKSRGPLIPYLKTSDVWECPSKPASQIPYGINHNLVRAQIAANKPIQLADLTSTSETILVTDFAPLPPTLWWEAEPYVYPPSRRDPEVSGRHFGQANVLWFDGHVATKKPVASYPVQSGGTEITPGQLQRMDQGDILKGSYTGNAQQDDYYFVLSK